MNWQNIAQNLQNQIGQNAAGYEGRIAVLTDQYTTQIQELQARVAELEAELATAKGEDGATAEETADDHAH